MGVCLDYGGALPYSVVVVSQSVDFISDCVAVCPSGHLCGVVGSGQVLPPEFTAQEFAEAFGLGFAVVSVPLAVVLGVVLVLRMLR